MGVGDVYTIASSIDGNWITWSIANHLWDLVGLCVLVLAFGFAIGYAVQYIRMNKKIKLTDKPNDHIDNKQLEEDLSSQKNDAEQTKHGDVKIALTNYVKHLEHESKIVLYKIYIENGSFEYFDREYYFELSGYDLPEQEDYMQEENVCGILDNLNKHSLIDFEYVNKNIRRWFMSDLGSEIMASNEDSFSYAKKDLEDKTKLMTIPLNIKERPQLRNLNFYERDLLLFFFEHGEILVGKNKFDEYINDLNFDHINDFIDISLSEISFGGKPFYHIRLTDKGETLIKSNYDLFEPIAIQESDRRSAEYNLSPIYDGSIPF